jgi:glycosyltransferase involved in cell wall biosynthesis
MKILVLAWEFPPRIVGGISRHVAELYPELVKLGHEIHLITVEVAGAPNQELVEGIQVYRVPVAPGCDFLHWVGNMNDSMGHYGGELILDRGPFDLIHAHDWLVGDAAIALKYHFKIPLIATIHATEYGRYNGIHNRTHDYIHGKEKHLTHDAWRVIVCSNYMRHEVERVLNVPHDKIDVIYNGIRPEKKLQPPEFDPLAFRRLFAKDHEKIVYYVGRMTHEKGVYVLLDAAPKILAAMGGDVKFILIGHGQTNVLKQQAWNLGIWDYCNFTGFMSDDDLDRFQTIADCAVFPSLYEPFGIVALESFAASVPVVVSNAGGLPEVVNHGKTGIVTQAYDTNSLACGILEVLQKSNYAKYLVKNAHIDLTTRFNWFELAQQTEAVYKLVIEQRTKVTW